MPLSNALLDIPLTRPCPHCGHKLEKTGNQSEVLTSKIRRVLDMLQNSKLDHSEARRQLQKILQYDDAEPQSGTQAAGITSR